MTSRDSHQSSGGGRQTDTASAQAPQIPDPASIERQHDAKWGHYLQATIRRNGRTFCKKFPERQHGGEQATMQLAQTWCDAIIAKYPIKSRADYCSIVRSNNTSGTPGVYFRNSLQYHDDHEPYRYGYWVAIIPLANGTTRRRTFAVSCYGDEGARQRALEARREALAALETVAPRKTQPIGVPPDDIAELKAWKRAQDVGLGPLRGMRKSGPQATANLAAQAAATQSLPSSSEGKRGEQHIARYENRGGKTLYWEVSVERRGKNYNKCFSDSTWGGSAAALEAAKVWRDGILRAYPVVTKVEAVTRVSSNNTSGVAGVCLKRKLIKGKIVEAWTALSPKRAGQAQRSKTFRIEKYGEKQAFALAVQAREAFVAELPDGPHFRRHAGVPTAGTPADTPVARPAPSWSPEAGRASETRSMPAPRPVLEAHHSAAKLLDAAKETLGSGSDFALSRALGVKPAIVSKLRNGRVAVDPTLLRRIHKATGIGMAELEDLCR